jgi:hypothetical protein
VERAEAACQCRQDLFIRLQVSALHKIEDRCQLFSAWIHVHVV